MRDQFLNILNQIKNTNISKAPNFQLLKALAVSPEVKYPLPLLVASSIKLNVNENFVNDEELFNETVKTYVSTLNAIWYGLMDISQIEAEKAFLKMVEGMSIEFSL